MDEIKPKKELPLKPRDYLFVKKIVHEKKPAIRAYKETHPDSSYESAGVQASILLKRNNIQDEVKRQLEIVGITDYYTDHNLRTLIDAGIANSSKTKPETALEAIKFVNQLKDRLPATKSIQATTNLDKLQQNMTLNELKEQLEAQQKETRRLMEALEAADK